MKFFLVCLTVFGILCILVTNQAYAMWEPLSPQELVEQSKTILVGTITSITPADVTYQSQISQNGTIKDKVGPEHMTLEKYTVHVEQFLKNPQSSDTITVLQATVGGVPGGPAMIGGFKIGDRVLFYIPKDEKQTKFPMQYLPESFLIPKSCDAKNILTRPRLEYGADFRMTQDGIKVDDNNMTAGTPISFFYERDTRTLFGKALDLNIRISKLTDHFERDDVVFQKDIHMESKPCEWSTSAKWEFTPEQGDYHMFIGITLDNSTETADSGFLVRPPKDFVVPLGTLIVQSIPRGLPIILTAENLEELSKYTLKGTITEIKPKTIQVLPADSYMHTLSSNEISVRIENKHKDSGTDYTIKFLAFRYVSLGFNPSSGNDKFRIGENATIFLTGREPSSSFANSYAGFITDGSVRADGTAYDVSSTKQASPLQQHKSGVFSRSVNCNEGLELLIKETNGQPICVTPTTKAKLVERGWAK